ncbi:MAG: four helix bundle protein [Chryseobacterium sp.]
MSFQDFKKLDVWLFARKLTNSIYNITKEFPGIEQFGLTNQMRRCAASITSNIAEGFGRNTPKGTLVFLYISRGSIFELETQLYIAFDQNYIDETFFIKIDEEIQTSKKLLNGFINYFKKQEDGK